MLWCNYCYSFYLPLNSGVRLSSAAAFMFIESPITSYCLVATLFFSSSRRLFVLFIFLSYSSISSSVVFFEALVWGIKLIVSPLDFLPSYYWLTIAIVGDLSLDLDLGGILDESPSSSICSCWGFSFLGLSLLIGWALGLSKNWNGSASILHVSLLDWLFCPPAPPLDILKSSFLISSSMLFSIAASPSSYLSSKCLSNIMKLEGPGSLLYSAAEGYYLFFSFSFFSFSYFFTRSSSRASTKLGFLD